MFEKYSDIINVKDLCEMLGIGKNMAYKLLMNNHIRSIKEGKKYIIPKKSVLEYISSHIN